MNALAIYYDAHGTPARRRAFIKNARDYATVRDFAAMLCNGRTHRYKIIHQFRPSETHLSGCTACVPPERGGGECRCNLENSQPPKS